MRGPGEPHLVAHPAEAGELNAAVVRVEGEGGDVHGADGQQLHLHGVPHLGEEEQRRRG